MKRNRNSFFAENNMNPPTMPYQANPNFIFNDIEERLAKIERQLSKLDHRITLLENKTTITTDEFDTTDNVYMI